MKRVLLMAIMGSLVGSGLVQAESQWMFIASPGKTPAIYAIMLDLDSGKFGPPQVAAAEVSTGFLALHPTLPVLYAATSEARESKELPNGGVRAYHIDRDTGQLSLFSQGSTHDNGTTHIAVNAAATAVAVCHYGGRGTSVLSIKADGSLDDREVATYAHEGSSVTDRQQAPHPHGVAFDATGTFVCVADLGNDHVEVLRHQPPATLERVAFWNAPAGAGPRHVAFHPNGKWIYCINELDNTIAVLLFQPQTGSVKQRQIVKSLPDNFQGTSYTAEVVVHPNGRFLYGSNRGHDSTVVCEIDQDNGTLTPIQHEPTQGQHPRFVGLDPTGRAFIAANMNSDNVVGFHIDPATGRLTPTGQQATISKPMCVVFVP